MEGQDKGLIKYQGRALIEHVIERLRPQVHALLINANRNQDQYAAFGYPVITDADTNFLGPLAGILAGLREAKTDYVLCTPCDSPYLSLDLASKLTAPLQQPKVSVAVAECKDRLQPVFAVLQTSLADELETFLASGGRKIDIFYTEQICQFVPFDDPAAFRNINTHQDLTD